MQSERNLGASLARAFGDGDAARDEVVVVTRGGFFAVDSESFARGGSARAHLWETYVETGLVDPERVAQGVHSLDPGFLPVPELRSSAAPAAVPAPAATPAPLPEPPKQTLLAEEEAATLEERMLVESAPHDPNVANAYAEAEEEDGGLTGFVLRLIKQQ